MLFRIILFLPFLAHSFCQAQHALPKLEAPLVAGQERNILSDRDSWIEQEKDRTVFSSTFRCPDGRVISHFSKEPLNYYKEGRLVPVNYTPVFSNNALVAADQPGPVTVTREGAVRTGSNEENSITYSHQASVDGIPLIPGPFQLDGKLATMTEVLPGIDKIFEFRFNSLEYSYVLKKAVSSPGKNLRIKEKILLPEGAVIEKDASYGGTEGADGWMGALSIRSKTGEEIGRIKGAVCFDADKKISPAAYKIEKGGDGYFLTMIVPSAWINDPARRYPVIVDPLVTGPTVTWTSGYIPSCFAPAAQVDSLLVTIPAQIAVTGLFVSSSYYANPFSTAVMSDGVMYFSTTCNQSTTFTVAPPAGSTAGTGYLSVYDLRSPLLCCKPQSCSVQTFYLRMHLYRTAGGSGCSLSYIYHDPFGGYPFEAYVEGHTVESYGANWNVNPNTICSSDCAITGTIYMRYGVPPYTITHPWAAAPIVTGTPIGCSFGTNTKTLSLTIPGCPWICDTTSTLSVPPATVVDACGSSITGIVPEVITRKPVPDVVASPNPATACSGVPFNISLSSCLPGTTITWTGNSSGGGTTLTDSISNPGDSVSATSYSAVAVLNGCSSSALPIVVNTDPGPQAGFSFPVPAIVNKPVVFTDNSTSVGAPVNSWIWIFENTVGSILQHPSHTFSVPGIYPVCLYIQTANGCLDTVCRDVQVIPAELVLPNVITPNNDQQNDVLYFQYLEFFGSNSLRVYDRWGKIVFQQRDYSNDWNAGNCSDGTYYFILDTEKKSYPGYVQIIGNK